MRRTFNVAGPNQLDVHYTLDPEPRMPKLRALIEQSNYFAVYAPPKFGKTTLMETLARQLTAEGRYTAIRFTIEESRPFSKNVAEAVKAALGSLRRKAKAVLPEPLRPPEELFEKVTDFSTGLSYVFSEWALNSPRPLVVFIDEIDAIEEDALISFLHQLRSGYSERPTHFPHSVVLIGMREVREYRARIRPERESMGSASPFNIKTDSLTLSNFSLAEVAALYRQHTEETGQQWYIMPDGRLDMIKLLREFQQFFRRESEIWLERYEYPDVSIQREVLEVKLYRDKQTETDGLEQLGNYLTALGEPAGHLLIFDRRPKRSWDKKIFRREQVVLPPPHQHLRTTVWGL